jgi:hypothetical protein
MKALNAHKGLLITIIVLAVGLYVYNSYFASNTSIVAPDLITTGPGADVVSLYSSLQSINFDQTLFTSTAYENLTDFSTALPSIPLGRSNPFSAL